MVPCQQLLMIVSRCMFAGGLLGAGLLPVYADTDADAVLAQSVDNHVWFSLNGGASSQQFQTWSKRQMRILSSVLSLLRRSQQYASGNSDFQALVKQLQLVRDA